MRTAASLLLKDESPVMHLREWLVEESRANGQEWLKERRREYSPFVGLMRVIEESRSILDLAEDWDEAGSKAFRVETWERAAALLISHAVAVWAKYQVPIPAPRIFPGTEGSIDLHWKMRRRELLINVPENILAPASFYGDDYGRDKKKGKIAPGSIDLDLFAWLTITD